MTHSPPALEILVQEKIAPLPLFIGAIIMALGWLVYGNQPYPEAAAVPGVFMGLFISLCLGRADWQQRWYDFALFSGVGWALGGMIPLAFLIGYTNTGAQFWPSMLYGIAALSLTGFIWAGMGGLFTAIPAVMNEEDVYACRTMIHWFIFIWLLSKIALIFNIPPQDQLDEWTRIIFMEGHAENYSLVVYLAAWFHFHGLPVFPALLMLIISMIQFQLNPKLSLGFDLVLQSVFGWFLGILIFVWMFDWRLSPPVSDAWAGLAGMLYMLGMFLIRRQRYHTAAAFKYITFIMMMTAFWGAIALPIANSIRLYSYVLNALYPSSEIMLLIQGLLNGIGMTLAISYAAYFLCPKQTPDHQNYPVKIVIFFLFLLTSLMVYHSLLLYWVNAEYIDLYPKNIHLSIWIAAAMGMLYGTVLVIRCGKQNTMIPILPLAETAFARWLLIGMVWLGISLVLARNNIGYMEGWVYGLIWILGCIVTIVVMTPGKNVIAPKGETLWQSEITRRTIHHVLSWSIITALIILALNAFHIRIILHPTKNHHFRFGPNSYEAKMSTPPASTK